MSTPALILALLLLSQSLFAETWHADNGNGTFTNPLFYDEFSDPDMIRVGDDFYLAGTTMHVYPGLPVLHSKDLVNWELVSYACDQLDFGPAYRLENGSIYGQGIWAPSFRYNKGTFYIFTNVNGQKTQLYTASNPAGPWIRREMKGSYHDLSVLFDDDGKAYIIWGYRDIHFARLNEQLDDIVPGTERTLFPKNSNMGEGSHFYKINGKYYITSAWFMGSMRMPCARADKPEGPYEVNPSISEMETFGLPEGNRLINPSEQGNFAYNPVAPGNVGRTALHQGGLVQTSKGEWWGFSMMDYNSVGRITCLSPVTWQDGWPYFGLPGNLKRTPRTWVNPNTGHEQKISAPYQRNDEFDGPRLANVWQWNHVPVPDKWSLNEHPGFLRLHSLPATDLWTARNTLSQRAIGPESTPSVMLDATGMKDGDVAGLALLNYPYAWIGVRKSASGIELAQFDQRTGKIAAAAVKGKRVMLRACCNFITEIAQLQYSTDGKTYQQLGEDVVMIFQTRTFQGVRYSLFHYNTDNVSGGYVDFDHFKVDEPHPHGLTGPIPAGKIITLENVADGSVLGLRDGNPAVLAKGDKPEGFKVIPQKLGRVAFQSVSDGRYITVKGLGEKSSVSLEPASAGDASGQSFQWTEMPQGEILLLSLSSHRHLCLNPASGKVTADAAGAEPARNNGASLAWHLQNP